MTKCEICDQDVLLRLFAYHVRQKHRQKETKEDESPAVLDVDSNNSCIRGSRAAAQKYVKYQANNIAELLCLMMCNEAVETGKEEV